MIDKPTVLERQERAYDVFEVRNGIRKQLVEAKELPASLALSMDPDDLLFVMFSLSASKDASANAEN